MGTRQEIPFPSDINSRLDSILNVVNTELKSVTLLHLDEKSASCEEIESRARASVGQGSYLPIPHSFESYCHHTLLPIGTVAEEKVLQEDNETLKLGFSLTEAGRKFGLPIAAYSLNFAVENQVSLFSILGSTASKGGNRAPLNRAKLLEALSIRDYSLTDLAKLVNIGKGRGSIFNTIKSFRKNGLIEYTSGRAEINPAIFSYVDKEGEVVPFRGTTGLTSRALEFLKGREVVDARQLADLLGHKHSSDALNILNSLTRQGFASRKNPIGGKFTRQTCTNAHLTDRGREFTDKYLAKIRKALNGGDNLEELRESYECLLNDRKRFREVLVEAIELYRQVSPRINQQDMEITAGKIEDYVVKNPGSRPVEIEKALHLNRSQNYLTPLVRSGSLRKEKKGKSTAYFAVK